jgi:hypothetical protein
MFMGESSENLRRLRHAAQIDTIPLRLETRANPDYYAFGHSVNRTAVLHANKSTGRCCVSPWTRTLAMVSNQTSAAAWIVPNSVNTSRHCGRRVAVLYAAGELFACRRCYGLVYASQQESVSYRGLGKAQKIRMRLGGSADLFDEFPTKPKGMHWRTYDRLRRAHDIAEVVRTHPATGRRMLYLGRRRNAYLVGLEVAESEALLDELWSVVDRAEFAWEHVWRVGDLVLGTIAAPCTAAAPSIPTADESCTAPR